MTTVPATVSAIPYVIIVGDPALYVEVLHSEDIETTVDQIDSIDTLLSEPPEHPDLIVIGTFAHRSAVGLAGLASVVSCPVVVVSPLLEDVPPGMALLPGITIGALRRLVGIYPDTDIITPADEPDQGLTEGVPSEAENISNASSVNSSPEYGNLAGEYLPSDGGVSTSPINSPAIQSPIYADDLPDGDEGSGWLPPSGIAGSPPATTDPLDWETSPGAAIQQEPVSVSPSVPPPVASLGLDVAPPTNRRGCTTVAFFSTKGGVGKTTVSCNFAGAVASMTNLSVCIVDIDIEDGNVGARLDLFSPTVTEVLNAPQITKEAVLQSLAHDEATKLFALLTARQGTGEASQRLLSPGNYDRIWRILTDIFDVVVLDCPNSITAPLVANFALQRADVLVAVIDTERAAIIGLHKGLKEVIDQRHFPREHVGLVINQQIGKKNAMPRDEMLDVLQHLPVLAEIQDNRDAFTGAANQGSLLVNRVGEVGDAMRLQFSRLVQSILPGVDVQSGAVEGRKINSKKQSGGLLGKIGLGRR